MDLTPNGRFVVGALALMVIGFGLAALAGTRLAPEAALPLIGGGATLLILASRRGRNGD